jgi:radical SAM-linked protein
MKVQRLRLWFGRGEEARDLSHLELMRALERALREADLPLAYSEGRRPTPQISFGAPLGVGVTSERDAADVYLSERMEPETFVARLRETLPAGVTAVQALEVGLNAPALQTRVRWADYEVDVPRRGRSLDDLRHVISQLLSARSFNWEHRRETKTRHYDLRPLVLALRLEDEGEGVYRLSMRLRIDQERSGRPDQVVAALGLGSPLRTQRKRLYIDLVPAAVRAHRLQAELEE